jgi:hypothetical protein
VQVNIKTLIAAVQCDQSVRAWRWPDGLACPSCEATQVIPRGFADTAPARQRSEGHDGPPRFDALTATIFAGPHPPLKGGIVCRYCLGLHRANEPMAQAWALHGRAGQQMTAQRREGMGKKTDRDAGKRRRG